MIYKYIRYLMMHRSDNFKFLLVVKVTFYIKKVLLLNLLHSFVSYSFSLIKMEIQIRPLKL